MLWAVILAFARGQNAMRIDARLAANLTSLSGLGYHDTTYKVIEHLQRGGYEDLLDLSQIVQKAEASFEAKSITAGQESYDDGFYHPGIEASQTSGNCYLVRIKNKTVADGLERLTALLKAAGSQETKSFTIGTVANGYKVCFPEGELPMTLLRSIRGIDRVERDQKITRAASVQSEAPWGLAALSYSYASKAAGKSLKGSYVFEKTGKGVTIYLVDSGIACSHMEFGGRASIGYEADSLQGMQGDCNGHGTEVASVLAGANVGVAKEAQIVAVTVLDCEGEGTNSDLVLAMDWIVKNHKAPAVVNLSVGGPRSKIVDGAIREAIRNGIPVVVAGGNSNVDACTQSPSGVESAIVVGACTKARRIADFSNYGRCIDIFAPGTDIVVANARAANSRSKRDAFHLASGTSLSSPFVAGIAALILEDNPGMPPAELKDRITSLSLHGAVGGNLVGSPSFLAQAPPPTQSAGSTSDSDVEMLPPGSWPDGSDEMSATAIILMAVGIVVVVALALLVILVCIRRHRAARAAQPL